MSADDRFDEIKRLLNSTIDEFQTIFQSAASFEDSQVGNGWCPNQIAVDLLCLQPRPFEDIVKIAKAPKSTPFRHKSPLYNHQIHDVDLSEQPKLNLVPYWRIKGFHECFYFRRNSYRIDLPEDVIAVDVEGKIRDLASQESTDSQGLAGMTRRLLGKRELKAARHFRFNEVTELAYLYKEGKLFVDALGKEDQEAEAFFEGKTALRMTSIEKLGERFPHAEIRPSSVTKVELVKTLHSMIVRPPATFSRILTNRFQITELSEFLVPVYTFKYASQKRRKEASVHAYTGVVLQP